MALSSNSRTSGFFHGYAKGFSDIYGEKHSGWRRLINDHLRKSMMLRFQATLDGCQPIDGRSVLDVGCGPGHYGVALATAGAGSVLGIDFADGMLDLAKENARRAGVSDRCSCERADFLTFTSPEKFDYVVLMGFMDYMSDPAAVVEKALSLSRHKAFFSFPMQEGFLAWQRRLRYRFKCDLYMYTRDDVERLFKTDACRRFRVDKMARDYFVTAEV
jgi:SAM-dependent methyltransferase